jgi:hypothetical protein
MLITGGTAKITAIQYLVQKGRGSNERVEKNN